MGSSLATRFDEICEAINIVSSIAPWNLALIMPTRFLIRFDDITPGMAWTKFKAFEQAADEMGLSYLIGVVPDCQDPKLSVETERPDFWAWLRERAAKGWTIAQHGHTHLYATDARGILGIGRKSEFAGLPYADQYEKLAKGKALMMHEGVWHGVFMAPSHSFDINTVKALKALNFSAITDGYGFYAYDIAGLTALPQLLARPLNLGLGVETICLHANTMTDDAIARMVAFMRENRTALIGFGDAIALQSSSEIVDQLARALSEIALRAYRFVRP
jgi:predicted deacetylase